MVYRYKISIKKQKEMQQVLLNRNDLSVCLFFAFWLVASVNWIFEDQKAPGVLIADILYYMGYALFGYFVYSLYYHFFRREFEPFILILIGVLILVPLIFIVDTIVSTLRLLSTQTVDISLVVVNASYPILAAIVIFPIALMFWGVRRINSRHKNTAPNEKESNEKGKSPSSVLSLVLLPYGYYSCSNGIICCW
jgi:hypothetical protein